MTPWKAAKPGDQVHDIDTPALVLDLDAFERNLTLMAKALAGSGVRLRPHAKSHKCPEIARRQIAHGAIGICCQKVSEAACFVENGIEDILITNQVVGTTKLNHLAALAKTSKIGVLVDHIDQVTSLAKAAQAQRVSLDVYIEIDVGIDNLIFIAILAEKLHCKVRYCTLVHLICTLVRVLPCVWLSCSFRSPI